MVQAVGPHVRATDPRRARQSVRGTAARSTHRASSGGDGERLPQSDAMRRPDEREKGLPPRVSSGRCSTSSGNAPLIVSRRSVLATNQGIGGMARRILDEPHVDERITSLYRDAESRPDQTTRNTNPTARTRGDDTPAGAVDDLASLCLRTTCSKRSRGSIRSANSSVQPGRVGEVRRQRLRRHFRNQSRMPTPGRTRWMVRARAISRCELEPSHLANEIDHIRSPEHFISSITAQQHAAVGGDFFQLLKPQEQKRIGVGFRRVQIGDDPSPRTAA